MTKYQSGADDLTTVFHALADPTRRSMVERLTRGPASMSQLAEPFEMAMPTVLAHLKVLEAARIVTSEKVGRVRTFQLRPDAMVIANRWLVAQRPPAERRLDRLGDYLVNRTDTEIHPEHHTEEQP